MPTLYDDATDIQNALDAQPRCSGLVSGADCLIGGTVFLAAASIDLGNTPLYIASGQKIRGQGPGATVLTYSGTGAAIRFRTYGGHGYVNEAYVENLTVISEEDGFALANPTYSGSPTANGEVNSLHLRDLVINANSTPINFDHAQLTYFFDIENVFITGWRTRVMKLGGTSASIAYRIRRLKFANNLRARANDGTVQAATSTTVQLETTASATNGAYVGYDVFITSGTGSPQRRSITAYNGSTRTATVSPAWSPTPTTSSTYAVDFVPTNSLLYLKGDGTIADSEIEGNINTAPVIEFVDGSVTWTGGHFETHTDQTANRVALLMNNTSLRVDRPQFLQPWIHWRLESDSRLIVFGELLPTDNNGGALDPNAWNQVLDIQDTSKVYNRGIDVSPAYIGTTPTVFSSDGTGAPGWYATLPAVSGANLTSLNASNVSSGTLSNARTTASSSNTASAIVARDASGNFSAGTITSGADVVNCASASTVGVKIAQAASQTANPFEIRDASNNARVWIEALPTGSTFGYQRLFLGAGNAANVAGLVHGGAPSNKYFNLEDGSGNGVWSFFDKAFLRCDWKGVNVIETGSAGTLVSSPETTAVVLTVKGKASQSANLQEWMNSSGTVGAKVKADTHLVLASATSNPSSPTAGQIYFNSSDSHFYGYNGSTWKQLDN